MAKRENMSSPKGLYSTRDNPLPAPKTTSSRFGPGGNADQVKANRLLQQAFTKNESLRGKSGMQALKVTKCPTTGLILPTKFVDEKLALVKTINDLVDTIVSDNSHLKGRYFLTLHAKFNLDGDFEISQPVISYKLPPFVSNQFVYYVSNSTGVKELLWMVPPKDTKGKLRVEFNKTGVAYLQAKGAMPKHKPKQGVTYTNRGSTMAEEITEEPVEETVEPVEEAAEESSTQEEEVTQQETQVPISALQKERRKRQDAEAQNAWLLQQKETREPVEEDLSQGDIATKGDVNASVQEAVRKIEETRWIRDNPERYELINEKLPEFLKQRPNLVPAINSSMNRFEEAWTLYNAFTPTKRTRAAPVKEAPGSPGSIPKAAAMNEAVDVMKLSDAEFLKWRKSKSTRQAKGKI